MRAAGGDASKVSSVYPLGANPRSPGVPYNGMVAPLRTMAIEGAIWYQGESNGSKGWQYRKLLPAMIKNWRDAWGQGEFPFLIVQLANFGKDSPVGESGWAELREAQTLTATTVPNCGLAVTIDIGNPADVHPTNKQEVGRRLGLAAEKLVYGHDVPFAGPTYKGMEVQGGKVRVTFEHLFGGLENKGEKVRGCSGL